MTPTPTPTAEERARQMDALAARIDASTDQRMIFLTDRADEARLIASALRQAAEAARAVPVGWVPEDELPESLPSSAYNALFPFSRVDGIRWFPIYAPVPASAGVAEGLEMAAEWHEAEAARLRALDPTDARLEEAAVDHEGSAHFVRALKGTSHG